MTKRIVLCADDFGQALAISQGIIALIQQHRLSATSCITNAQHWPEHAKWLVQYKAQVAIGLHFNLTEGRALSAEYRQAHGEQFLSLSGVMRKAFMRTFDQAAIESELEAQLDSFMSEMGSLPHFVDGHQHVHQFPVIRDALVAVYQRRLHVQKPFIRLVNEKLTPMDVLRQPKKMIIFFTGTSALKKLLDQQGIRYNRSFAGIYSFAKAAPYSELFPQFLNDIEDGGLIMCHPGLLSNNPEGDVIAANREEEYQYLASNEFLVACESAGVSLTAKI